MSASVQYKLLQFQESPPEEVWARISQQLQEEYHPADIYLSQKITDASITPPPAAWEAIAMDLAVPEQNTKQPRRIVPLFYQRIAAAVIGAFVAGIVAMYLFNDGLRRERLTHRAINDIITAQTADTDRKKQQLSPASIIPQLISPANRVLPTVRKPVKTAAPAARRAKNRAPNAAARKYDDPPRMPAVQTFQAVSVNVPPIRDKQGNIIMDLALISSPDSPHIIVTSPNGTQTKISSKFLHCLSYLNGNISSDENDMAGLVWKTRFQEWRNQLLREAAFIPSANNFLDILELKDMIRER